MAKNKANKDKEDDSGANTPQDDDDFGLPELEYEALDDDDDDTDEEEESSSGSAVEESPAEEAKDESSEEESNEPEKEEETSVFSMPEQEEEDTKVSSIFDMDETSPEEEMSNVYGSPSHVESSSTGYDENSNDSAKSFTRIIIFGAVTIVLIGFLFLYFHHKDDDNQPIAKTPPKEVKATPKKEPAPVKKAEPVKKEPVQQAAEPAGEGEVVVLPERTGRSYVIVGSFFDGDLANDYGKELAEQGKTVKIIKPFGKSKFFRVSVADYDTYKEALAEADKIKSSYDEVWALRY